MKKINLTDRWITRKARNALDASGEPQIIVWDSATKFFGLRIGRRGSVFIVQAPLPNGKRRRVTIGKHPEWTVSRARSAAKEKIEALERGERVQSNTRTITLQAALDLKVASMEKLGKTPESIKEYLYRVEHYLADWLTVDMASITDTMIEAKFAELSDIGHNTANKCIKLFATIYRHVKRRYGLPENPAQFMTDEKKYHRNNRRKHPRQMKRDLPTIWNSITAYPNATLSNLIQLIAFTGCRPKQARSLTWLDVDFAHREMTFRKGSKTTDEHTIPMCNEARAILIRQREQCELLNLDPARADCVFPAARRGTKFPYLMEYKTLFTDLRKSLDYDFVCYDWRRFMASSAVTLGLTRAQARHLQNHCDVDAHDGYESVDTDDLRDPLQAYENHLRALINVRKDEQEAA